MAGDREKRDPVLRTGNICQSLVAEPGHGIGNKWTGAVSDRAAKEVRTSDGWYQTATA